MEHYVGKTTIVDIQTFKKQPYKEFTGTVEEKLYTVEGIDSSVMLCSLSTVSKKSSQKALHLWFNSNDIKLKKGSDLFEKLLHIKDNYTEVTYMPNHAYYDLNVSSITNRLLGQHHIIRIKYHGIVNRFLEALNNGTFVYESDVIRDKTNNPTDIKKYAIVFQLKNNLCIPLFIYDDGFVRLGGSCGEFSNLLVKVDTEAIQALIELFFNNDTTTITIVD